MKAKASSDISRCVSLEISARELGPAIDSPTSCRFNAFSVTEPPFGRWLSNQRIW
ncbi:hypothetical protein D3C71_2139030 [compost metagenome]